MDQTQPTHTLSLQERLEPVLSILDRLDQTLSLTSHQESPPLAHQVELKNFNSEVIVCLEDLNPGEVAHLLEMLHPALRAFVWKSLGAKMAAEALIGLPSPLAENLLIKTTEDTRPLILDELEPEDLAELKDLVENDHLKASISNAIERLPDIEKEWVHKQLEYDDGQIGDSMSMDRLVIHEKATVAQTVEMIQSQEELPEQTDKVFVCDRFHRLLGEVPLMTLLRKPAGETIVHIMNEQQVSFLDTDPIEEAILAFEHYDLISAPVVDRQRHLIGRLTIEAISDIEREQAEEQALARDGLKADQDIFTPTLQSARHRWSWLALNLVTAFLASGCIRLFEGAITQLVALATLMPIVASLGGNAGNQTIALFIRGLGTNQINDSNLRHLATKEVCVNLINGIMWGSLLGLISFIIYQNMGLALVLATATALNLVLASIIGVAVPLILHRLGRDPAMGSSVILTFCTDSLGFFIFLGLAASFLL